MLTIEVKQEAQLQRNVINSKVVKNQAVGKQTHGLGKEIQKSETDL